MEGGNFYLLIFNVRVFKLEEKSFIELKGINKTFDDGFVAVRDFNLQIKKGEFVTLLGPSGCGKTTTINMIAGFEQPTRGQIRIGGIDIKDLPVHKRPCATVFQNYALFPNMTVYKNICYGLKVMRTPLEKIPASKYDEANKVYQDAIKVSEGKKKDLEKKRLTLQKKIDKEAEKYSKNAWFSENKEMRLTQFNQTVVLLRDKIAETHDQAEIAKIEKEILELKNNFKKKKPLDAAYDKLMKEYSNVDYWLAYWESYPVIQKENFEKRSLTRKLTKKEINERASKMIEKVGLTGKEDKYPSELSGGMQQRVALARALVIEPDILLLDEPLSALDAKVRKNLQDELKRLHQEFNLTFILVTHDQEEALMLSDKIVVMSEGDIEQVGTPSDVYDSPSTVWVAKFIGEANIFDGVYLGNHQIKLSSGDVIDTDEDVGFSANEPVKVLIRPEDFDVVSAGTGVFDATITNTVYKGLLWKIEGVLNDQTEITVDNIDFVELNSKVGLKFDPIDVHMMKVEH